MNTLFPVEPLYPEGFTYTDNFLSAEEEARLIDDIKKFELHNFTFQGYMANRRVASFGFDYSFENGKLAKGKDIPVEFNFLIEKVANAVSIPSKEIAELLITEYTAGTVINWHRDAPPFDIIAGISLSADCTFRLRPYDKVKQSRSSIVSVLVKRRSLYVMRSAARSEWQHSIAPVKQTRYSITLRTLKS
jgi:alkylated DNA repair dioxygenase AlkB